MQGDTTTPTAAPVTRVDPLKLAVLYPVTKHSRLWKLVPNLAEINRLPEEQLQIIHAKAAA